MNKLLMAAALFATTAGAAEPAGPIVGQTPHIAYRTGDYAFQMFVPRGYADDRRTRWPLMIFLHGSGERGTDVSVVAKWGPPAVVACTMSNPFIDPRSAVATLKVTAGASRGNRMERNVVHLLAPKVAATAS